MKVGDKVRHRHHGWSGTVMRVSIGGAFINFSSTQITRNRHDHTILFRWIHRTNLEVISAKVQHR